MPPILELEVATGRLLITDIDGRITEHHDGPVMPKETEISRVCVDFGARALTLTMPDEVTATIAFQLDADDRRGYLASRLIVYLDQNHWSTIANTIAGARPVSSKDAAAVRLLGALADQGRIVLPLSAGHTVETSALYGRRRTQVASAMLEMSQGWVMRHPCWIRKDELASARDRDPRPAADVFTQEVDQLFTRTLRDPGVSDLPEPIASLSRLLVNTSSVASMLLEPEQLPDTGGRAAATAWAADRQQAAANVRADQVPAQRARQVANAQVLADAAGEILQVWGAPSDELTAWYGRSYDDITRLPSLSRQRAIFYGRIRSGIGWEPNDFNDILYLSSAGGYADVVVGERRTSGELRNGRDIAAGARVASNLPEAVATIVELLAERAGQPTAGADRCAR
jgi:hypothetical protein